MEVSENEVIALQELWIVEKNEDADSVASSGSCEECPPHGLYLRECFGKLLTKALREIVLRRPVDPVEYLAHWLLHYKVIITLTSIKFLSQ